MSRKIPLVYSCSGCSSAAQMANQIAVWLDRNGAAEMSCIAGVGGGVTALVKTAQSGRPILALDGCALACVSACLARAGVTADKHLLLSDYGVKKRRHVGFDEVWAAEVYVRQALPAALGLAGRDHAHVASAGDAGAHTPDEGEPPGPRVLRRVSRPAQSCRGRVC